jgi:hypothetical protein
MLKIKVRSLAAGILYGTALIPAAVIFGGCSDDKSVSEPEPGDGVEAAIDAPSSANLLCDAGVSVHYSGENSNGDIDTWEWKAAHGFIGNGPTVDRTFYSPGSEWTQLSVCSAEAVCDSTRHILQVEPAVGCLDAAAEGDWRLILPPGGEVVGHYSLESSTGDIERHIWLLDGDSIGSQSTLQITFGEIGRHRIDGIIANSVMADTATLTTLVKEEGSCPPQLRSDSLAFFRQEERDGVNVYGLYFMHGMDGGVRGPVYERDQIDPNNSQEPCGNRVVFGLRDADSKNDINLINKDGSGLTLLAGRAGIEWHPSWAAVGDWIAYVDDTRWDGARDEISLIKPDGSIQFYLSGNTIDRSTTGFHPAFDPSGDVLALGSVRLEPSDSSTRVYLYSGVISGNPEMRPLHTEDQLVQIYGTRHASEGAAGVTWSADSLWIAYTLSIGYVEEIKIVAARSDGSGDVRFIQEGSLSFSPSWSPDSHYIVYSHVRPDGRVHIYRTSLQGGAPVDLSAKSLGSRVGVSDWAPSWAK